MIIRYILEWIGLNRNYLIWMIELAIAPILLSVIYSIQFNGVSVTKAKGKKPMNPVLFGITLYAVELVWWYIILYVIGWLY